jgi:hypothetical protein
LLKSKRDGFKFYNEYMIVDKITTTQFSKIFKAQKDSNWYALKVYNKLQLNKEKQYKKRADG